MMKGSSKGNQNLESKAKLSDQGGITDITIVDVEGG